MSFSRSLLTRARTLRCTHRRSLGTVPADTRHNLFEYTSGRWIMNNDLRIAERKRVFNADGLRQLAAQFVNRSADEVLDLEKNDETDRNQSFLITMRDGFQMVARIPYDYTPAKYHSVASEAATMAFLRASGLPVPRVYGYSPVTDNAAGTEYIFMEHVSGTPLNLLWLNLDAADIVSIMRQAVQLEAQMMAIPFPAVGCLYYTKDLDKLGAPGIALEDANFSVGPDSRPHMWSGKRAELEVDRGPYKTAEAFLLGGAAKELAYLKQFGQPRFPLDRVSRFVYGRRKQQPSDHIANLMRYNLIARHVAPTDPTQSRFAMRHHNLHACNIIVSRSLTDSTLKIVSLIDFQHNPILPFFLLSVFPGDFANSHDPISQAMTPPPLPETHDGMDENARLMEKEYYRRRLVHYHYLKQLEEHHPERYASLTALLADFRQAMARGGSGQWDGDSMLLRRGLMGIAEELWPYLCGDEDTPCPIAFDEKQTMLRQDTYARIGCRHDTWSHVETFDEVLGRLNYVRDMFPPGPAQQVLDELWGDLDEDE
ncbi:protein kinase subdomain-containing protein PKL CAK Fmp29 [Roridomyces roridus]|uniref:Protein kinase subdomain-containing protein PKL CAK Fmp29 n=1 Tax=Roridomyces roridus TaxID=1738132 RepID=A0AAD7CDI8_9AGAR|nr:protein kinase subdomain-containing protein PKL CAK Fmp29 [Roridomyces roridus]